jgi:hypothetical protein
VAYSVNLLYAAKGRQPDDFVLESYTMALADRTDYQVEMATNDELRAKDGDFPITAQGLRVLCGNYPKDQAEAEQKRRDATRRLPSPVKIDFPAMRNGMLGMTHELLAAETDPKRRRWYEEQIVRLEKQQADENPMVGLIR